MAQPSQQQPQGALITYDNGPWPTMSFGVSGATFTSSDQSGSAAAVTDAPASGQKLVLTDLEIATDTNLTVTFTEETTGTVVGKYYVPAYGPVQITPRGKRKLATADKKIKVQTSAAGNLAITAHYYSET